MIACVGAERVASGQRSRWVWRVFGDPFEASEFKDVRWGSGHKGMFVVRFQVAQRVSCSSPG